MSTPCAQAAYSGELLTFYHLTLKAALAYSLYLTIVTFLPEVRVSGLVYLSEIWPRYSVA